MNDEGSRGPFTRVAAMPGKLQMTLAACLCAGVAAGCGGSDDGTIPREEGQAIITRLDALEERVQAGECEGLGGAEEQAVEVERLVGTLPDSVETEVRDALVEASANLIELTAEQCTEGATGESGLDDTTTTRDTTTTDETVPTTTTTTTTDETTTDESDNGDGGGNAGGGNTGGGNAGTGNQGGGNTGGGNTGGGSGQGEVEIEPPPDTGGVGPGGKAP